MENPLLIDAHSHINFSAYRTDADAVIGRAEVENIWMFAVGSQIDTSRRAVEYAEKYPHVWAAVGLHPTHLIDSVFDEAEEESGVTRVQYRSRAETFDVDAYRALAAHPRTVAIGECGLDRFHTPDGTDAGAVHAQQEEVFRQQITLAQEVNLPLIIHVRDAHEETIAILADTRASWRMEPPFGLIHC